MKQRVAQHRRRGGFTLIEVLLVLAILGVIAAMVVPQLLGQQKKAYIDATKNSIKGLEGALEIYAFHHDSEYPTTQQGLDVLISQPANDDKWVGPYLKSVKTLPLDAWGQPFQYEYPGTNNPPGTKPDIYSSGPDRIPGNSDDINNWQ